jgi:hypothetical protein
MNLQDMKSGRRSTASIVGKLPPYVNFNHQSLDMNSPIITLDITYHLTIQLLWKQRLMRELRKQR